MFWSNWNREARLEKQRERDHQVALLNGFLSTLETIQSAQAEKSSKDTDALIAVAQGMTAQAQSFSKWLELFQQTSAPTSTVITEEDEYRLEQQKKAELGYPVDIDDLPAEFQLAYALKRDPNLLGLNEPMTP